MTEYNRKRADTDFQVPGLGRQVPGSGIQHQVQVQARTRTRTWQPVPDSRLPRPETRKCVLFNWASEPPGL